ncbi:MAG TPA: 3-dehydroquinate synthase [Alphaproteobacteria bacterium]|jgi:3-dehydroquinate synthase
MNDAPRQDYAAAEPRARIRVELGARSYDIAIGPGALDAVAEIRALRPRLKRVFAVADETVERLHGAALRDALARAGLKAEMVILPPGEATKSFAELERLCDALLAKRIERDDVIVAFGGGVIGDLAGFAAGILLRGIDYVQVPTTLLAQVDSSVGGKTAIDTRHGKNLVGAFHQPRLVVADTALLDTLARRERLAGYAEIAKYGLIGDAAFFAWLERAAAAVIDRAGPERTGAVAQSCRAKARVVAADEREAGERALLNFGHTFAHALETECGYGDELRHGEAVALGMAMAFDLSAALGLCAPEAAKRVRRHFASLGLPTSLKANTLAARRWPAEPLVQHMQSDKKVRGGRLTFILVRGVGEAFIADDVPAEMVMAALRAHGAV